MTSDMVKPRERLRSLLDAQQSAVRTRRQPDLPAVIAVCRSFVSECSSSW